MQHYYGIQLAFSKLVIRLNSTVVPNYSGMFSILEVCSLRICEGMYICTVDVFKKMRFYVRIYNECKISEELRSTAEVVLHAEHPLFWYCMLSIE